MRQSSTQRAAHAKGYIPKLCITYIEKISAKFGVNVENDESQKHPKHICHTCYCKLFNKKQCVAKTWNSHPRTSPCQVCEQWELQAKGGGQKKRKFPNIQRRDVNVLDSCIHGSKVPQLERFQLMTPDEFNCGRCNKIASEALESPCQHLFCLSCLKEAQVAESDTCWCNLCKQVFPLSEVSSPREYFHRVVSLVPVTCTLCKATIPLQDAEKHLCGPSILQRPLDTALTPAIEAIGSHVLKSKLRQSSDGATVSFKTRGQPIQVMHIPKPRKDSNEALPATVRKRCQLLAQTRAILSKECPGPQLVQEVKQLPKEDLKVTLEQLNLSRVTIPKGDFLTVKAEICTTWKKARELKRWVGQHGITSESEGSLREEQKGIIIDNERAEWVSMLHKEDDGGTIIKTTPLVGVKSLSQKIFHQLNVLDRLALLKWNDAIPREEIWVQIGDTKVEEILSRSSSWLMWIIRTPPRILLW
ncbi:hypothetical protein HOLleu_10831 [Holothuria leucospilota]|uniref:RING-type domain-containing protein n=1 Tax=Holothuria leucospilota TaxID=206669 RepID=A0A9Q1CEI6_HOLLE|nr:hypothetical protein HOLleu_10831 [Holothuria leucospilota]